MFLLVLPLRIAAIEPGIPFVLVEYNCENFFDCSHDTLKEDNEFMPDAERHWTWSRYWRKANDLGRVVMQCGSTDCRELVKGDSSLIDHDYHLPDIVALCEVENDSALVMLTRRAVLRQAGYKYVMTSSPDIRGVDVALLYNPFTFRLLSYHELHVEKRYSERPTRNILYVKGQARTGDTLHVFVLHAPSRSGGAYNTEDYRLRAINTVLDEIDSIRYVTPSAYIIVCGDFNDYSRDKSLQLLSNNEMFEVSEHAQGLNVKQTGCMGTYKYRGMWDSLDHVFLSSSLLSQLQQCYIYDASWLLEEDDTWGGTKPRRMYKGTAYTGGVSDHLPLVLWLDIK